MNNKRRKRVSRERFGFQLFFVFFFSDATAAARPPARLAPIAAIGLNTPLCPSEMTDHTLMLLCGPPGAGKTTVVTNIMEKVGSGFVAEYFTAKHPDGNISKKTGGVSKVAAGCALNRERGIALLGRFKATHPKNFKNQKEHIYTAMQGADRMGIGAETGTWNHLLRKGVSPLSDCKVFLVDSCDYKKGANPNRLQQAAEHGWQIKIREILVDRETSRRRCKERNFNGDGTLTVAESNWNSDFAGELQKMRAKYKDQGWDYAVKTHEEIESEVLALLGGGSNGSRGGSSASGQGGAKRKRAKSGRHEESTRQKTGLEAGTGEPPSPQRSWSQWAKDKLGL